jgi:hypothetical protein
MRSGWRRNKRPLSGVVRSGCFDQVGSGDARPLFRRISLRSGPTAFGPDPVILTVQSDPESGHPMSVWARSRPAPIEALRARSQYGQRVRREDHPHLSYLQREGRRSVILQLPHKVHDLSTSTFVSPLAAIAFLVAGSSPAGPTMRPVQHLSGRPRCCGTVRPRAGLPGRSHGATPFSPPGSPARVFLGPRPMRRHNQSMLESAQNRCPDRGLSLEGASRSG